MKKILYILLPLLTISMIVSAQKGTESIIDDINKKKYGQGNVRVMQDESIDNRLALHQSASDTSGVIRLSDEKVNGFKIQVYSGQSRTEAESKQDLVRTDFKRHQAEVTFNAPLWRLRVGNFLTREEAERVLAEMKEAFPSFGKEMYIVNDVIRRPLQ